MIKPKEPNRISLADLKRSKNSTTFFNMLFDIRQFENLAKKADYFGYYEEVYIRETVPLNSLSDFFNDFKIKLRKRKLYLIQKTYIFNMFIKCRLLIL